MYMFLELSKAILLGNSVFDSYAVEISPLAE